MKTTELRIGNFVLIKNELLPNYKDEPVVVTGIESRHDKHFKLSSYVISVQVDKYNGASQFDEFIKPIPLTEEWLVKFGFEKHEADDVNYHFDWWENGEFDEGFIWQHDCGFCFNFGLGHDLEHVHQLQNLYFTLIGEELSIKTPDYCSCAKPELDKNFHSYTFGLSRCVCGKDRPC